MMRMLMVLVAVGLTAATGALARAPELSVSDTRPFGYFIGDAIHREVVLRLAPGDVLDTASLPRPGPLNYWLELSKADLSTGSEGEDTLYRLSLVYQTFYAPLDTSGAGHSCVQAESDRRAGQRSQCPRLQLPDVADPPAVHGQGSILR